MNKYVRVMDGLKSNAGNFEYKLDEINIAKKWNTDSLEPEEMGGFNFGTEDKIYDNVTDEANTFFTKRGYVHSWDDCNCFDMRSDYSKVEFPNLKIGDTIDGITYRWATTKDIPSIIKCTDDAHQKFSKYYKDKSIYNINGEKRVLIALDNNEVCGTLMVCSDEAKEKGIGSVGCTTVKTDHQGKHIGVNMVILGNKILKDAGIKEGYLGYTYSGLDKMYGYAGYKICIYYNMAIKQLIKKKNKSL